jgi:hypothetical protein
LQTIRALASTLKLTSFWSHCRGICWFVKIDFYLNWFYFSTSLRIFLFYFSSCNFCLFLFVFAFCVPTQRKKKWGHFSCDAEEPKVAWCLGLSHFFFFLFSFLFPAILFWISTLIRSDFSFSFFFVSFYFYVWQQLIFWYLFLWENILVSFCWQVFWCLSLGDALAFFTPLIFLPFW